MKSFTFQAPPNILFEAGASKKLAELVCGIRGASVSCWSPTRAYATRDSRKAPRQA